MVYIQTWPEFQQAAEELYLKSPDKTRYTVKWRSCEGKLVLKVTDDVQCIKYKTFSSAFLNRFEALNLSLMEKMQNLRTAPSQQPEAETGASSSTKKSAPAPTTSANGDATTPTPSSIPAAGGSVASGSGVKKKKKGKKK